MKYTTGDDPTIPEACEPFGFGEVEDFTLKVEGATVAPPTGSGLRAEYFVKDKNLAGTPVLTRTDSTVNFNWRGGSPDAQLPCDKFSVRWTGQVEAQYSETYTFITRSDDGVRLWVNGERIIDNWTDHAVQRIGVRSRFRLGRSTIFAWSTTKTGAEQYVSCCGRVLAKRAR